MKPSSLSIKHGYDKFETLLYLLGISGNIYLEEKTLDQSAGENCQEASTSISKFTRWTWWQSADYDFGAVGCNFCSINGIF